MEDRIYKVVSRQLWTEAEQAGTFRGAPIDLQDGFIHFSTAGQVVETVAKHFAGQDDLLLVEADATRLGETLKWEVSRGGERFPHLYEELPLDAVLSVVDLPLGANGNHVFPAGMATQSQVDK